ncbi:H/ACA ribonucleoprotein complex subunit NHP2 [Vairimorpha necatrix]|uniref:H/ACA ribonucleoprotein complex subunit NHP2 n=1 Tax=Vairimorpha necatrix TaxID=6039 RepID=A0AAX4J8D0_9MICR
MMPIATPLASEKQLEMINEAIKSIEKLISGIKACTKEIKKESKGVVVLSADTTPMDLITHIPALCEEKGIKYIFVEKKDLLTKPCTCVFINKGVNKDLYETIK